MIKIKQAVIVEGKYDKITLENIIDALIISTDGFRIFKNEEKRNLIRALALSNGIIVMTDSDSAGRMIRSYIKQFCPEGKITNVYIPKIKGKERRKESAGKEGLLGVEGMSVEVIVAALEKSGVFSEKISEDKNKITKTDLYNLGLSGKDNSSAMRRKVSAALSLPEDFSANAFLDILNTLYTREDFLEKVKLCLQDGDKN